MSRRDIRTCPDCGQPTPAPGFYDHATGCPQVGAKAPHSIFCNRYVMGEGFDATRQCTCAAARFERLRADLRTVMDASSVQDAAEAYPSWSPAEREAWDRLKALAEGGGA